MIFCLKPSKKAPGQIDPPPWNESDPSGPWNKGLNVKARKLSLQITEEKSQTNPTQVTHNACIGLLFRILAFALSVVRPQCDTPA